jgi:hypothetical protein
MAGGLMALEYFIRLRERAHWKPPTLDANLSKIDIDDQPSDNPLP